MTTVFKNALIGRKTTDISVENSVIVSLDSTAGGGIDIRGKRVIPGLIDIHTHGCGGFDSSDGEAAKIAPIEARHGTTALLPTLMTAPIEKIRKLTDNIPKARGAKILGYNLEGPYISPKYAGAQDTSYMTAPNINDFKTIKNSPMITLAPELDGAVDFIKSCEAHVSLGHTACDYDTAMRAFAAGADCITHTFNAMTPIRHREPGIIPAAADAGAFAQVICDGVHIHPAVIRMLYKLFGADKMILISDSMSAAGLSDGEYTLGGSRVTVRKHIAHTPNGAIAGSTSFLLDCVKKAVEFGIPFDDAVKMASETPARYLSRKLGRLEIGYPADFVVLDDSLDPCMTVIDGTIYE
jgi:N-acetylglucosamine-6-phosphate deacetylase